MAKILCTTKKYHFEAEPDGLLYSLLCIPERKALIMEGKDAMYFGTALIEYIEQNRQQGWDNWLDYIWGCFSDVAEAV